MTEPNKGGRKPVPDHLKRKRRIYFLNEAEALSTEQHIASLRGEAVNNRPNDRRLGKKADK